MNKDNGGPAFPGTQYSNGISPSGHNEGLSLRDYFAAKALAMVGAANAQLDLATWDYHHFADYAYRMADAMLAERAK